MSSGKKTVFEEGNVTTEILDLSEGIAGSIDTDSILQRTGGGAGSYTEVRPDGTKVTYEVDVEEFEEEWEVRNLKICAYRFKQSNPLYRYNKSSM